MSLATIQQQAARLSPQERKDLIGYLISLNQTEREAHRRELARKIDCKDPSRWVTLEEAERRLFPEGSDGVPAAD
jgi:hypothetical protein